MASHLNPPNWQSHVCNFSQLIRNIEHAGLTRLPCMKVEIYQLPTLPTSLLWTSSPTSGAPLAPSGSFPNHLAHRPKSTQFRPTSGLKPSRERNVENTDGSAEGGDLLELTIHQTFHPIIFSLIHPLHSSLDNANKSIPIVYFTLHLVYLLPLPFVHTSIHFFHFSILFPCKIHWTVQLGCPCMHANYLGSKIISQRLIACFNHLYSDCREKKHNCFTLLQWKIFKVVGMLINYCWTT